MQKKDDLRAVRWANKEISTGGGTDYRYTQWHWSESIENEEQKTICGLYIRIVFEFPDENIQMSKVTCLNCLKILNKK